MLIDREGVLEDTENIEELKRRGVVVSIKESDLARIDMHIITDLIAANIVKENLDKYENSVSPLYGISMRLFRRFIRESVFAQAGVDLVDFEYAQTRAGSCATSSSLSLNSTNNVFN